MEAAQCLARLADGASAEFQMALVRAAAQAEDGCKLIGDFMDSGGKTGPVFWSFGDIYAIGQVNCLLRAPIGSSDRSLGAGAANTADLACCNPLAIGCGIDVLLFQSRG